jgi:hypothetical protein
MSHFAATANHIAPTVKSTTRRSWKNIVRRIFEGLGKHYAHGPYMQ